jgi:hypothetical protein
MREKNPILHCLKSEREHCVQQLERRRKTVTRLEAEMERAGLERPQIEVQRDHQRRFIEADACRLARLDTTIDDYATTLWCANERNMTPIERLKDKLAQERRALAQVETHTLGAQRAGRDMDAARWEEQHAVHHRQRIAVIEARIGENEGTLPAGASMRVMMGLPAIEAPPAQ